MLLRMIHATPAPEPADLAVLALIRERRDFLRYSTAQSPHRWTGALRRNAFARAMAASNTIEGINATIAEAGEVINDERPDTIDEETYRALNGYRTALTYVLQIHNDPELVIGTQLIKSLHFMMLGYDLSLKPGQWRSGPVFVVRAPQNETVYEGPDASDVPPLMEELAASFAAQATDPIIMGAMAHLNLVMIHPFRDGNGRMARALQSLVIARSFALDPVFCSIEEWLGRNTRAYYAVLAKTARGSWNPHRDARPFVRFCIGAHYQQAETLVRRNMALEKVHAKVLDIVRRERLGERAALALVDAAAGFKLRAGPYQREHGISDVGASRDFRKMCDAGLLIPHGIKRGRFYLAAPELRALYQDARSEAGPVPDPYELIKKKERTRRPAPQQK